MKRSRRVGTITCGILLILFGILFLVHMFWPLLSLRTIMKLWPLILVALGSEMIAATLKKEQEQEEILKYDKGAVFLVILLAGFAVGMGIIECCMSYALQYGTIYY